MERGLYGGIVGLMYAIINLGHSWEMMIVTSTIGFSIGFFTGLLDQWLFNTRLRRQKFIVVLFVRSTAFLVVIILTLVLVAGIYTAISNRMGIIELMESQILVGWVTEGDFAYIVFYSMVVLLVLQFVTLVSRLLGPNVLLNYLLGRYHTPKEEERIFMFVDLRSSTTIAEMLGPMNWHRFLNDFFFDLAKPIRRYRGEIYQYVGDEVVISWPKDVGVKNLNCIKCFFSILTRIESKRDRYLKKYGYEPVFKAGYHVGTVIVGEIGDYKRDIVFHGDTVNTASRIQVECNNYDRRLLLSNTLLDLLELKGQYVSEYITKIQLRGKEEVLELYSLDPVEMMDRVL
ncbi:MAG: adenylate/guanylate cyclase domain-containing protein [Bacteroidetes bacterium]|nr:adenylate/guanylate cyclase domain-containing protein [Bacteroidota bacterium]